MQWAEGYIRKNSVGHFVVMLSNPYDMSVESNFTFDLMFLIHQDSEKIGFHFFFVQNLKWQPSQNDQ